MSRWEAGMRVLAIRDGGNGVLNVFGEGTYVGDLPRPGTLDDQTRAAIEQYLNDEDSVEPENHWTVAMFDEMEAAGKNIDGRTPAGMSRDDMIESIKTERARPFEDRVQSQFNLLMKNPCIHLDSGDIVWGMQCWWGPLDQANEKYKGWTINTVPVPDGNGRWKE